MKSFSLYKIQQFITGKYYLQNIIEKYKIDIVHFLFATPYSFWGNFLKTPYIITTRGSDVLIVAPKLLQEKGIKGIYFKILYRLLKRAFKRAVAITSTSEMQKNAVILLRENDKKVFTIRTGIDSMRIIQANTKYLPKELIGNKFIFSPRYIQPIYNLELQIAAIQLLKSSILDSYWFVFVKGKKTSDVYHEWVVKELDAISRLRYIIFESLSQQQMWSCFNATSATLMVPHSDGTPNSALEAMVAKSPLIVGNISYDKELFDKTCFKLKENKPIELAESIESAISGYPQETLDLAHKNVIKYAEIGNSIRLIKDIYLNAIKINTL